MDESEERWLDCPAVQFHLSISRSKLDGLVKGGKLHPVMLGNRLRFSYNEIRQFMESLKQQREIDLKNSKSIFINALVFDK